MASTSTRTQAREAARARKAAADEQRRRADQIELDAATKFAVAHSEREAADARAAEQVRRLDELPETRTDRIATLLGVSRGEITRLRKLAALQSENLQSENDSGPGEGPAADEQSAASQTATGNAAKAREQQPPRTSEENQDGEQVSAATEAATSETQATS